MAGSGHSGGGMQPIVIKKVKKGDHGAPHGNTTWKIALADFMTAMFIIFLLLWLIKQTTPEQRAGIADYFSPASASRSYSGSGSVLGGKTIAQPGAMPTRASILGPPGGGPSTPDTGEGTTEVRGYPGTAVRPLGDKATTVSPATEGNPADRKRQDQVAKEIRQVIQELPELQGLSQNVSLEKVPEGLLIQLIDSEKQEMFGKASAAPLPGTQKLLAQVAKIISTVPNKVAISGYTDSVQFGAKAAYTNWELSADRANATRRMLSANNIPDERIATVTGKSDREPLVPEDPNSPRNRRISITLLNEPTPPQTASAADTSGNPPPGPAPEGPLIKR